MVWAELAEGIVWAAGAVTPDLWSPTWLVVGFFLFVLVKFVKVFSEPTAPTVVMAPHSKHSRIAELVGRCTILRQVYRPPMLWGRNGHCQTAVYGVLGHATLRRLADRRHSVRLSDGTTVTFDVFDALNEHSAGDFTLVLCPGIANSSESNYIRTCVHYAQEHGYRCAVLNHLGALADVPLTSPRVFTYGGTAELEAMVCRLAFLFPTTQFVCVGFSMGGNITTRFLASCQPHLLSRILCGLSVCQGYDASASAPLYHDWENGRRLYNYIITENLKQLLRRNYESVVAPHVKSGLVDEQRVWASTTVIAFDESYTRRVHSFASVDEYYRWCSCLPLISNLRLPMVFLNALDDPLIPPSLWKPVEALAGKMTDTAFVLTKHGGHLGFLEGASLAPRSVSWLDRLVVEMADAAVLVYASPQPVAAAADH